jgi:hypothetical protein
MHAMVFDPGEARAGSQYAGPRVEFRHSKSVLLPDCTITGLNPFSLSAYGLHACGPTLKVEDHSSSSKGSLLGGWPNLTEAGFHPLECATLPGRT